MLKPFFSSPQKTLERLIYLIGHLPIKVIQWCHRSRITIHSNELARFDACRRHTGRCDGRNAVLPSYDAAVAQHPPHIRNHCRRHREQRRPGGRGDARHQHIARLHLPEIFRAVQHPWRRGDNTAAQSKGL